MIPARPKQPAQFAGIDEAAAKLYELSLELIHLKKYDEARRFLGEILKHRPDFHEAHFQLGNIAMALDEYAAAEADYHKALAGRAGYFEALNNLGTLFYRQRRYDEAITFYEKALELEPESAFTLRSCAGCLANTGQAQEAMDYYHRALRLDPSDPEIYNDLLLTQVYSADVAQEILTETAKTFGTHAADKFYREKIFANVKDPARKLRIGYVSPDFRDHPVRYFMKPLLARHDRARFEIFAYSNTEREDSFTQAIRQGVDHWRDIRPLEDDDAAKLIERDGIDILVDLAGHTGRNRLLVFARRPAPVQATWLGFPATTGMKAMDYRITDGFAEPPGMTEPFSTETLWRLPRVFCCYAPHEKSPDVALRAPFEENGFITFGCFNNFEKVSNAALLAWAEILKRTRDARLLLEIAGIEKDSYKKKIAERLEKHGIPPARVILEPRRRANQFVLYNRIDIALDPFPCNGGTTSMDTLWMGVPLVTLAGKHFVSRMGVTFLENAGLPEFIAQDTDEYISIAAELANAKERLKEARRDLRGRIAKSPLMDQEGFTRDLEAAYRGMWEKYCTA